MPHDSIVPQSKCLEEEGEKWKVTMSISVVAIQGQYLDILSNQSSFSRR